MVAEDRLKKAKHHLDRLHFLIYRDKAGTMVNPKKIHYELEHFLITIRSVPDYLLEDYNKKYALGISLDDKLHPNAFKRKARELRNEDATSFIKWYEKKLRVLYKDEVCLFVKNKRDISIHRQEVTPVATRGKSFAIDVLIGKPEDFESLKEQISPEEPTTKNITFGWFFTDYRMQDILSICEHYYEKMKSFLEETRMMSP